ncbi:MAG: TolC family protein [Sandaracinaceae bacterium]|nr:TolC family protein [Sandaracinaceae bacterium]
MIRGIGAGVLTLVQLVCASAAAQAEPGAVTLEALLEHAEQHSPTMSVARATSERWRADEAAAEAPVPSDPQLQVAVGPRLRGDASDVDVSLQLRQRLEIAGEPGVRREVARRSRERQQGQLELAWYELHHAVHSAYHRALVARERVGVAQRMLAFDERLEAIARRRVELGEDSPLTVSVAELERLRAQQRLTHEQHGYLDARLQLAELTGWPSEPPPAPIGALEPPRRAPPVATLVALAREHGPQLAMLRATAAEARARATLADREGWPEPAVGLNYQLEGAPGEGAREHQILGVLSFPFPFFHRNPVGRANAEVDLEVARAEESAADLTLPVRVRRLAATTDAAAEQLERYRDELLPTVERQLGQLEEAFRIGELDVLRVARGRELVLDTQLEALVAYAEYYDAVAALADALGVDPWPDAHHQEPRR